ncbi:MAG: branched-chain amino acid ABC transporter permease, partial [Bdellovibrionales bacterium]
PSLILFLIAYNLNHNSQIGRAFKTIRCDHEVSMIMGIPVVRYKLAAFVLSGIYGAISGSFLTFLSKFIFPESFTISNSIDFVVATVVGGTGSLLGSVIGGVLMSFETDFFDFMANQLPKGRDLARVMVGILPIVAILLSQKGVAGELNRLFKAVFMNIKIRRGANRIAPPPDYDYFEAAKNSYLKRK